MNSCPGTGTALAEPLPPDRVADGLISRPRPSSDPYRKVVALDPASARPALQPGVEAAHRDADHPTQPLDRETGALGGDEAVPQGGNTLRVKRSNRPLQDLPFLLEPLVLAAKSDLLGGLGLLARGSASRPGHSSPSRAEISLP